MAAQEDIDAAVATIGIDVGKLQAASARLMEEIAVLQGQGVNTDGLLAALNALDVATGSVDNIVPVPTDPPVDPTPVVVVDPATGLPPVDTTLPTDPAPVDEPPVDEVPVDEVPVDEVPADQPVSDGFPT